MAGNFKTALLCGFLVFAIDLPASKAQDQSNLAANSGKFKMSDSLNEFAFNLYKEISRSSTGRNVFLSPFSISTALAMVYLGARGNTKTQMTSALHLDTHDNTSAIDNAVIGEEFKKLVNTIQQQHENKSTILEVANRLFAKKTFALKRKYLREVKSYLNASVKPLDFQGNQTGSRQHINRWVSKKTSRRINDLIPDGMITPLTKLIMVNAIYFRGAWKHPFGRAYTGQQTFHVSRNETATVQMMHNPSEYLNFRRFLDLDCKVVELKYVGDRVSMFLFVPNEVDGLEKVENGLNAKSLDRILRSLSRFRTELSIPRFTLKQGVNLKTHLMNLGIKDAFVGERANFKGIEGSGELFIDEAVHEAFVEVNEEGTEAAGATKIKMIPLSMPISVIADKPFLFLIAEKTSNIILFLGRFVDPRI